MLAPAQFRAIGRVRRDELAWALATLAGVILLGTLEGILIAVAISVLTLMYQANHPPVYAVAWNREKKIFRRAGEHAGAGGASATAGHRARMQRDPGHRVHRPVDADRGGADPARARRWGPHWGGSACISTCTRRWKSGRRKRGQTRRINRAWPFFHFFHRLTIKYDKVIPFNTPWRVG